MRSDHSLVTDLSLFGKEGVDVGVGGEQVGRGGGRRRRRCRVFHVQIIAEQNLNHRLHLGPNVGHLVEDQVGKGVLREEEEANNREKRAKEESDMRATERARQKENERMVTPSRT